MTFVWHPEDAALHELRVALAQVAIAAFGLGALPRVRVPLIEGERIVILKASSKSPGAIIGPTDERLGRFVDKAPEAVFDAFLRATMDERDGEMRVDIQLVNVRLDSEQALHTVNAT
jgi:hypothetical protein